MSILLRDGTTCRKRGGVFTANGVHDISVAQSRSEKSSSLPFSRLTGTRFPQDTCIIMKETLLVRDKFQSDLETLDRAK